MLEPTTGPQPCPRTIRVRSRARSQAKSSALSAAPLLCGQYKDGYSHHQLYTETSCVGGGRPSSLRGIRAPATHYSVGSFGGDEVWAYQFLPDISIYSFWMEGDNETYKKRILGPIFSFHVTSFIHLSYNLLRAHHVPDTDCVI